MKQESIFFFSYFYIGGSLSNFTSFRSGALIFFERLGLLVLIGPFEVPEVPEEICRDSWMIFDKFADPISILLGLLLLLIVFYKGFFYLDINLASLGNLFIYCCCACYLSIRDLVRSILIELYYPGCLLRTCYSIVY